MTYEFLWSINFTENQVEQARVRAVEACASCRGTANQGSSFGCSARANQAFHFPGCLVRIKYWIVYNGFATISHYTFALAKYPFKRSQRCSAEVECAAYSTMKLPPPHRPLSLITTKNKSLCQFQSLTLTSTH